MNPGGIIITVMLVYRYYYDGAKNARTMNQSFLPICLFGMPDEYYYSHKACKNSYLFQTRDPILRFPIGRCALVRISDAASESLLGRMTGLTKHYVPLRFFILRTDPRADQARY